MNDKRYQWILYVIIIVIIATIAIQVYWNYKNYLNNKQQLISDVQSSLDKAVDDYYTNLAEQTTLGIFLEGEQQKNAFKEGGQIDILFKSIDTIKNKFAGIDSLNITQLDGVTLYRGTQLDSMSQVHDKLHPTTSETEFIKKVDSLKSSNVNFEFDNIELLTSKIVVSINSDSLNVAEVDSLLSEEFKRKQIGVKSKLFFYETDVKRQVAKIKDSILNGNTLEKAYNFSAFSQSTFLPKGSVLELKYSNETLTVLKRSFAGILISTVLVLAVISCLFYLLKIIKHQKQLAEVKNDLISNITHEFKTPIATIGVALESISNFNGIDDKEKTKKYIKMSSEQLGKLNIMVEKLLETATLDSDNLELNKETTNVVEILNALINRYILQFNDKTFNTNFKTNDIVAKIDVFHFENAINNILDNAVKYGGDLIAIDIIAEQKNIEIIISDNGNTLNSAGKEHIFEKFYRIPKGNTHDVKGFGIGLYYTKTIIEKHNGTISLDTSNELTSFKITLPYGTED